MYTLSDLVPDPRHTRWEQHFNMLFVNVRMKNGLANNVALTLSCPKDLDDDACAQLLDTIQTRLNMIRRQEAPSADAIHKDLVATMQRLAHHNMPMSPEEMRHWLKIAGLPTQPPGS